MKVFLSYARGDDESFAQILHDDLAHDGFDVWFDREKMPSRGLTFTQEIRDEIAACERLLLIIGPESAKSEYVRQEWRAALEMGKCVNPVVRLDGVESDGQPVDGYALIPDELKLIHAEDFRDDGQYPKHLVNLARQLSERMPPLGKLVAVPNLPRHYLAQTDRLRNLRDAVICDLRRSISSAGASARVGLEGMGGIGKSVLAASIARDVEVRRVFPDGVFWLSVGLSPNLLTLQQQLVTSIGGQARFEDVHQGTETLRNLLEGKAACLILDDVWRREQVTAFDALGARCKLILTTRDASLASAVASTDYQVQVPGQSEAMQLLSSRLQVSQSSLPPEAALVVDACGCLPLAVTLCGGMVKAGTDWRDLLDALREGDLEYIADQHAVESHHQNVWRVINASVHALEAHKRDRFIELAVFPAGMRVPENAVVTLWSHTGGMTARQARQLLVQLAQRSLIQLGRSPIATETEGRFVTVHDLVHMFVSKASMQQFSQQENIEALLIEAYRQASKGNFANGPDDGYFLEHFCEHLVRAKQYQEMGALLTDLEFLRRTAQRIGSTIVSTGWPIAQFIKEQLSQCPQHLIRNDPLLNNVARHTEAISAALELHYLRRCGALDEQAECKLCRTNSVVRGYIDLGGVDYYDNYFAFCCNCLWAWHIEEIHYTGGGDEGYVRDFNYETNTY